MKVAHHLLSCLQELRIIKLKYELLSRKVDIMKKQYAMVAVALAAAFSVTQASAGAVSSQAQCTLDSYTITKAAPAGQTPVSIGTTINATKCYGTVAMEPTNNPASIKPDGGNLGYLNDGLLNGENGVLPWTTFITSDQLQDLNPAPGTGKVDPGWIQLGTMSASAGTLTTSNLGTGTSAYNLNNVLTFTQDTTSPNKSASIYGTWSLNLDADIINKLHTAGLFQRNNFDQLAFVVKASNSWAVYDFDFTKFGGFDLTQPYSLSGTWNLDDFQNKNGKDQELSFLGVWARDPVAPASSNVPEPGMLALFGAGMLSMAALRRRRQAK